MVKLPYPTYKYVLLSPGFELVTSRIEIRNPPYATVEGRYYGCLGSEPGKDCVSAMKELDLIRIQKSDREAAELQKKARQSKRLLKRKLEEQLEEEDSIAGPSYAQGMY
ncbi:hypothetical protein J6590_064821 [Homalodisca vitripennis]|nr:hypothetical protein J6590_064821 [Homalodisca vitripennis]